jgi:NAD+ diphosphatase
MDPFLLAQRNAFVTHAVNRTHTQRLEEGWFARTVADPATRFVVVWQDKLLVQEETTGHLSMLSPDAMAALQSSCANVEAETVLLGTIGGTTYVGVGLGDACEFTVGDIGPLGRFLDLRGAASFLDPEDGALAAQAKAMLHWRRQHHFCGRCGAPTCIEEAGYVSHCTNESCGQISFPRVDPAIIVLVTSGERCLLGRQATWPRGRYSNIAGFVEPGECLETAVAREVHEETGVRIHALTYHSSQPWPFPQSLMIGYTAQAATLEIQLNDGELEDAKWFTREIILEGLRAGTLGLPSPYSISFHLIEDWFNAGQCGHLADAMSMD